MSNTYALNHARRLHSVGMSKDQIRRFLRSMTTATESREILATLDTPEAIAA